MNTPLFDVSLSFEKRIDWLIQNLTVEEKLGWMGSRIPGCERLGVVPFGLGGEAAHGIQGFPPAGGHVFHLGPGTAGEVR